MDANAQVVLAGRLGAALLAAGLRIRRHKQRDGHSYFEVAEMVNVVGCIYHGGYVIEDLNATEAPTRPARLLKFPKERAG